jgi:pimeloyl-ACP methyl ester carboxylesterase
VELEKSTIVRAIRLAFRVMEKIAPYPGSVLAERLWCTQPKGRPVTAGQPGDVFKVKVNGREVVAEAWGEGPVVYLVHGWGGRRAQLDAFVEPLLWTGYRVITFDAPGHGDSEPGAFGAGRGLLPEFYQALRAVIAVGGPARAIIAHSLGAAATGIAVLDGLKAGQVVLLAPIADPIPYTREFARALGFGERIRTGFLRRLERRVGRAIADFQIPRRLRGNSATLPPAVIIHDRGDREVHFADAEALAEAWPGAELVATEGLGHYRIMRDTSVVERVVAHLSPVRV